MLRESLSVIVCTVLIEFGTIAGAIAGHGVAVTLFSNLMLTLTASILVTTYSILIGAAIGLFVASIVIGFVLDQF